jgi:hypothetical protein
VLQGSRTMSSGFLSHCGWGGGQLGRDGFGLCIVNKTYKKRKNTLQTSPTGFELVSDETLPFDRGRYASIAVIKTRNVLVEPWQI